MKPIFSVIIVSFNSKKFLDQCLASLLNTALDNNKLEIIVIDNASTDGTYKFLQKKYPTVHFQLNSQNLGFAKANNLGIKNARGKYILLLNPDTLVPEDCLPEMADFMEKNKNAAIATCRVEMADGTLDDACHRGFPSPWNAFCHFTYLANIFPSSLIFNGYHLGYRNLNKIHQIDSCAGAFMLVRKSVGDRLNWLDEDYFWYGEDLDFCFRAKQASFKVFFVPFVKMIHYKGISSGIKKHSLHFSTADKKTKIASTRARFEVMRLFYRKHYRHGRQSWLSPLIFAMIVILENLSLLKLKLNEN